MSRVAEWVAPMVWPLVIKGWLADWAVPMAWLFALTGWVALGFCLARLRALARGRVLVSQAAHELRGSGTALTLAVEAVRRQPGGRRLVLILESELERLRAALDDLDAARDSRERAPRGRVEPLDRVVRSAALAWRPAASRAGRPVHLRWEAGDAPVHADRGRLAQAFGNLLANAIEHGRGPVVLRARRRGRAVRVEITDRGDWGGGPPGRLGSPRETDRGHGLEIARRAVAQTGGSLTVESTERGTTAAIELPMASDSPGGGSAAGAEPPRSIGSTRSGAIGTPVTER